MKRNPEKAREAMRRWRMRHAEADRVAKRAYYERNTAREKARVKAYRRAHPDVAAVVHRLRRARELAAPGRYTTAEWRALLARYGGRCSYCGSSGRITADHRVPLAKGGTNTIDNIVPACQSCNAKKRLSSEAEFRARLARGSAERTTRHALSSR